MRNQARRSNDGRTGAWIDVKKDDWRAYETYWKSSTNSEDMRKRNLLETLEMP